MTLDTEWKEKSPGQHQIDCNNGEFYVIILLFQHFKLYTPIVCLSHGEVGLSTGSILVIV